MKQTTILFIGDHVDLPGRNRNVWHVLPEKLNELGWNTILTSDKGHKFSRLIDILSSIYRKRKHYHLAIIDVFSGKAFTWSVLGSLLLRIVNKPYILWLHGGNLPHFSLKYRRVISIIFKYAYRVIAPSGYLRDAFKNIRNDIQIIPNPIDISQFNFRLREKCDPKLVWVRSFHKIYDPLSAVESLALILPEYPDASLVMVGPDKRDGSLEEVKQWVLKKGIADRITITGGVAKEDVPFWLDQGDVFLNTSVVDNMPSSINEALASGLCVVSTNVGGISRMIDDGREGILVPAGDVTALASAVKRILQDDHLASSLSLNGRCSVEHLAWSAITPQWEAVLRSIVEQKNA